MTEKDAQLIESLARADVRNDFIQKIAASVAASPVLATSKQAVVAPTSDISSVAASVGGLLDKVKSLMPTGADMSAGADRLLRAPGVGHIAGNAVSSLAGAVPASDAVQSLSPLGNKLFRTWADLKANPSAPSSPMLSKAVAAITDKPPSAAAASGAAGEFLGNAAGKFTGGAGQVGKSVGLDMFKGLPKGLNNMASYLTTGKGTPEPSMSEGLLKYLDNNPTLALALGGAGVGGISALGAGLYGRKKPRRLIGNTIGGALAGAALGGGLGAIGSSLHDGGRLSDWYKDTKDFMKSKDTAVAKEDREAMLTKLEQISPETLSHYRKAEAAVRNNPTPENLDAYSKATKLLTAVNQGELTARTETGVGKNPDDLASFLGLSGPGADDPGITADTEIDTSPWQRGTLSGTRNPASPGFAMRFGLPALDTTLGGISSFGRSLIKNKHMPLSTIDVHRKGFQRWMAERMQAAIDSAKSQDDPAAQMKMYRQLISAGDTVSDDNVRSTIEELHRRAASIVSGDEKNPASMLDEITTGRMAVDPSTAADVAAKARAARSADPARFDSLFTAQRPKRTPRTDAVVDPVLGAQKPPEDLPNSILKTLGLDKFQPEKLRSMGLLNPDGSVNYSRLRLLVDADPDMLGREGMVFDAGHTMPASSVENAARRAHLDQAPRMSYSFDWPFSKAKSPNPAKPLTELGAIWQAAKSVGRATSYPLDWLVNSRHPAARLGRIGGRYGIVPGMAVAHGLSNMDDQANAARMLKAIDDANVSPDVEEKLKRQILARFPALGYENQPAEQP